MSDRTVIALDQSRRAGPAFPEQSTVAMLVFLIFDSMILTGMIGAFVLTRTSAGVEWPPPGRPWFTSAYAALNTAALLISGVAVYLAGRAWSRRDIRIAPHLTVAMALALFFVLFQGLQWLLLLGQGLRLNTSEHENLFCLIVATHAAHVVGAIFFMWITWRRMRPLRTDGDEPLGLLRNSPFLEARLLWYFTVGSWPILHVCLYL